MKHKYVRINSNICVPEKILSFGLNKEQQRFCLGVAILNEHKRETRYTWTCPHCALSIHDENYHCLDGRWVCLKCKQIYEYPRQRKEKYTPPNVFIDKLPIEQPDWL